jgi:hypothetical protein
MVLRVTSPMPQGGSRKRGTFGARLSEAPNMEFEGSEKTKPRPCEGSPETL